MSKQLIAFVLSVMLYTTVSAQTVIRGKVSGADTGEAVIGATVMIKGKLIGTVTNNEGVFELSTVASLPLILEISYMGYQKTSYEVRDSSPIAIRLEASIELLSEVVFSASRIEEPLFESAITVEKMDLKTIRDSPDFSFYDGVQNLRGVDVVTNGITSKQFNSRGFNSTNNSRFLQLIDGVDNQPPGLNFAIGNLFGASDIDVESVELIPGSSSALYGPVAFNGVLMMRTKDPFLYQGLSVQVKAGVNNFNNRYTDPAPLGDFAVRYAKAIGDKFAFKVNGSYFSGLDWYATNYDDIDPQTPPELRGENNPARDAVNIYGDEVVRTLEGVGRVSRTGYEERDLMNYNSYSAKFNTSLNYRFSENMELSYSYNIGKGRGAITTNSRNLINNFIMQQHKVELKGSNYFVRGYLVSETSNDSYNARTLGQQLNRTWVRDLEGNTVSPAQADNMWFERFSRAFLGEIQNVQGGSHSLARAFADEGRLLHGSADFDEQKTKLIQVAGRNGAGVITNSKLYHAEGQYDFSEAIKWFDLQAGGSVRYFDMFSNGTLFDDVEKPITILEGGAYVQMTKKLIQDRLKLGASLRYDKNENFKGRLTPRASGLFQLSPSQNLRASFQTGFRNPTPVDQFIHLNVGPMIILGGVPGNSAGLQVYQNSFTSGSASAFGAAFGRAVGSGSSFEQALLANKELLVHADVDYIKPERISTFEIGYRGIFSNRFTLDINYYYGRYTDFILNTVVIQPQSNVTLSDGSINPAAAADLLGGNVQAYQLYTNADEMVSAQGATLGLTYSLARNYSLTANGTWADFNIMDANPENIPAFNTPEFKTVLGLSNNRLTDRLGFSVSWRWQSTFDWAGPFTQLRPGEVPAFSLVDAQVSYKIPNLKTILKVGANNLLNNQVYQSFGSPSIGGMYFVSLTFDEMMR
jgi:iron complex outermembrane receptor protein